MARGVRKSPKEKLTEQLQETEAAIAQYSDCLEKQKALRKELLEKLEQLEIAELSAILKEKNMSVDALKEMVSQAG